MSISPILDIYSVNITKIMSPGCMNTTQKSTGKWEVSHGEKQKNHDNVSRLGDVIHANPFYWQRSWQDRHLIGSKKKEMRRKGRIGR